MTIWLAALPDVAGLPLTPASGDASFRRYFRLRRGRRSWIAMDAPPPMEDCRPFIRVAGYLQSMSLNVPEILATDLEQGFVLMTDLGSDQYLDALRHDPDSVSPLYEDALAALMKMQQRGTVHVAALPEYHEALLQSELSLFRDWLCGRHLGFEFSAGELGSWRSLCELLVGNARMQPSVFVHRDFHSRNLMRTNENNPGILDFQDAVAGPLTYDLVSLLKDCYFRLPVNAVNEFVMRYFESLDNPSKAQFGRESFLRCFDLMGIQRHLKAAGIFARLLHRDGKDGYMRDVPQTLRYIVDAAVEYPELGFVARLIAERCLPQLEAHS